MEEQIKQKPFAVELNEAKNEIIQAVNNAMHVHNMPCTIIEMILSDIYNQIKEGARNELTIAKEQMENENK